MDLDNYLLAAAEEPSGTALVISLAVSAALVFGYRVYRLTKGGPLADAVGGAILAAMLIAVGALAVAGVGWARWPALVYAILFGVIVMPVWTLAVYIPSRPGAADHVFIGAYWLSLVAVGIAAVLY